MNKSIILSLLTPILLIANEQTLTPEIPQQNSEPKFLEMPNPSKDRVFVSGGPLYLAAQQELKFQNVNYYPGLRVSIGSDSLPDNRELQLTLSQIESKNVFNNPITNYQSIHIETIEATIGKRYQFSNSFSIKSFWGVEGMQVQTEGSVEELFSFRSKKQKIGPELGIDIRQNIWKNLDLITLGSASIFGATKAINTSRPLTLVNKVKLNLEWGTPKTTDGLLFHISAGYEFQYFLNDTSNFIPFLSHNFLLHGLSFKARLDF